MSQLTIITIIIFFGFVVFLLALIWFLNRKIMAFDKTDSKQDQALLMLQRQLADLSKVVDQKLGESNKAFQIQYGHTVKIVREVTAKLEQLESTNKQVINFAEQLKSLEDILKNPKHRGILGEYFLETLLSNVLQPQQYKLQYTFKNGETVDAVIFVKDKLIPIDAKFSLEKYNLMMEARDKEIREQLERGFKADLKIRIDETSKYIRPKEGTTDFAFMFIPAEGVYYNLLIYNIGTVNESARDLVEYAFSKRVIIVSPTSFFAYLQTVLHALRSFQIEKSVKEIIRRVSDLNRHLVNYDQYMKRLGGSLSKTVNSYNMAYKEFGKIDKDVARIADKDKSIEIKELEGPNVDE